MSHGSPHETIDPLQSFIQLLPSPYELELNRLLELTKKLKADSQLGILEYDIAQLLHKKREAKEGKISYTQSLQLPPRFTKLPESLPFNKQLLEGKLSVHVLSVTPKDLSALLNFLEKAFFWSGYCGRYVTPKVLEGIEKGDKGELCGFSENRYLEHFLDSRQQVSPQYVQKFVTNTVNQQQPLLISFAVWETKSEKFLVGFAVASVSKTPHSSSELASLCVDEALTMFIPALAERKPGIVIYAALEKTLKDLGMQYIVLDSLPMAERFWFQQGFRRSFLYENIDRQLNNKNAYLKALERDTLCPAFPPVYWRQGSTSHMIKFL